MVHSKCKSMDSLVRDSFCMQFMCSTLPEDWESYRICRFHPMLKNMVRHLEINSGRQSTTENRKGPN